MATKRPTVLVVEDEVLLLQAICTKLKLSNIDALSASSAQQALDYLKNLSRVPEAIWLDYYLGDSDGITFMKKLRSNKKFQNIPVMVISNSASPQKVQSMYKLGIKKYLIKADHRLDEIITDLKELIKSNKTN